MCHDVCQTDGPLNPSCSVCANTVCAQDAFCCQQAWDNLCVQEAENLCGANCGMCVADGGMCAMGTNCCSGNCSAGICSPPCQPDGGSCMNFNECCSGVCAQGACITQCSPNGSMCTLPSDCCDGMCNGGVCGAPQCPMTGQPCADCTASKCCNQLQGCLGDPTCTQDVACVIQCVAGGGQPIQCFTQCGMSPQELPVLTCIAQNCGNGVCF